MQVKKIFRRLGYPSKASRLHQQTLTVLKMYETLSLKLGASSASTNQFGNE